MNFTNFFKSNLVSFQIFDICHYSSFPAPGGKEPYLGFANSLLKLFFGHVMVFNILISFTNFFDKVAIFFFKFLKFLFSGQGTSYRVC